MCQWLRANRGSRAAIGNKHFTGCRAARFRVTATARELKRDLDQRRTGGEMIAYRVFK